MPENLSDRPPEEIKELAVTNLQGAISQFSILNDGLHQPVFYDFLNSFAVYVAGISVDKIRVNTPTKGFPVIPSFMHFCADSTAYDIYQEMKPLLPQIVRNDILMAQEESETIDVLSPSYMEKAIQILVMTQYAKRAMKSWGI